VVQKINDTSLIQTLNKLLYFDDLSTSILLGSKKYVRKPRSSSIHLKALFNGFSQFTVVRMHFTSTAHIFSQCFQVQFQQIPYLLWFMSNWALWKIVLLRLCALVASSMCRYISVNKSSHFNCYLFNVTASFLNTCRH